jgi:hypothetical protein
MTPGPHAVETKVMQRTTRLSSRATRRMLAVGALAFVGSAVACKAKSDAKVAAPAVAADTVAPEPVEPVAAAAPEPAPVVSAPLSPISRNCSDYTIRDNGIGAMEIGEPQSGFRTGCIVTSDSAASGTGTVVVGVNGAPVEVQVTDGNVYRLTVTDPAFRTVDGLGPGVSVVRLLDYPGAVVLEGDHDLSVVVGGHCGLYFRIAKPATVAVNISRWADVVRAMPPETPVERVVVHGCR